jgi:hypothetical protein
MPISYQFQDRSGVAVELNHIDLEICKDFSIPFSESNYSLLFMTMTMIGDFANRSGKFEMDEFDAAIRKCEFSEDDRWKILKYINGKYIYKSWR